MLTVLMMMPYFFFNRTRVQFSLTGPFLYSLLASNRGATYPKVNFLKINKFHLVWALYDIPNIITTKAFIGDCYNL